MLPELTNYILDHWRQFFPDVPKPGGFTYLGITGSPEGGTTTFLAFRCGGAQKAEFVVKIHRDHKAHERVKNERAVLTQLQGMGPGIAGSVPRHIFEINFSGIWFVVQSVLPGRPMTIEMGGDGLPMLRKASDDLCLIVDWLMMLHRYGRGDFGDGYAKWSGTMAAQLEEFDTTFDLSGKERRFVERAREGLGEMPQARCVQHGDFNYHNILITGNGEKRKTGVIDWTDARLEGFALYDLFNFLVTYGLVVRKSGGLASCLEVFLRTFFEQNGYSRLVGKMILDYCDGTGLYSKNVKILFGLFLIQKVLAEYAKAKVFASAGGFPRFSVHLAALNKWDFQEAAKEPLWRHFFRTFVEKESEFLISRDF